LVYRRIVFQKYALFLPDGGRSLKRLHRPNRLEFGCMRFKENPGLKLFTGLDAFALNAGLMKPRRGFTPVLGKKKLGGGEER
jgi:hypothetical protein